MKLQNLFGKRIRELRKKAGYTQEELSCKVDVDSKSISRIETGKFLPSLDLLYRLSKVFDIEYTEMFNFEHLKEPEDLLTNTTKILKTLDNQKLKLAYKLIKTIKDS